MGQPKEYLRGPLLKGPVITDVRSSPVQWAGRTTINSGSATVTVSTRAVKSDSLVHLGLEGNANLGIIFGSVNINYGAATATVSNAAIASTSRVFLQPRQNAVAQGSGTSNRFVEVLSLGNGSVGIGWSDGASIANRQTPVDYMILPTDGIPGGVEVKTISDSGYFTIGRVDGRAVARNTTVLWQITNSTHH